jgi:hypothetical protein
MAGTNGKPKFLRCNRNDEVENLKIRGTLFVYKEPVNMFTSPISVAQWFSDNLNIFPGAPVTVVAPTSDQIYTQFSQEAPGVLFETAQLFIGNHDSIAHTLSLPGNWVPSSITLPPMSQYEMIYQLVATNPPTFWVRELIPAGSTLPANNATPPSSTLGSDFALSPALPFDVIVRNAANTAWVPSISASTGGNLPWARIGGTVVSPTNDILRVADLGINGYSRMQEIANATNQTVIPDFKMLNVITSASTFGGRGVGTTDTMVHTSITNPPGALANGYFYRGTILGTGDVFYVRTSGVTKITLSAGPPVTNIAVDALGQICAAASSVTVKENIINATDTTAVNDIQVREFNYIGDNVKQIGAIVEEMEPLIPEALRPALINYKINWAYTDEAGVFHPMTRDYTKPESINTQGVLFCLIKELQALRARVALLEAP